MWLLNRLESGPSQQTRSLLVTACWERGLGFRWLFPGSLVIAALGPVCTCGSSGMLLRQRVGPLYWGRFLFAFPLLSFKFFDGKAVVCVCVCVFPGIYMSSVPSVI